MVTERTRSPSLVLDLRRAERRRLHDAAHAGQLDQPLSERVRGGRADRVDGEQAGVPGQDFREAGPQQVDAHVPPGLEHVPRTPAHVAHHGPGEVAHGLGRRRPQDGLQDKARTTDEKKPSWMWRQNIYQTRACIWPTDVRTSLSSWSTFISPPLVSIFPLVISDSTTPGTTSVMRMSLPSSILRVS